MPSPIEPFYQESLKVLGHLGGQDTSAQVWLRATLAKTLVLVAVSYFDAELTSGLDAAFRRYLADGMLLPLALRDAVEMKFHSLFKWHHRDAEFFLSHFGRQFREDIRGALKRGGDQNADEAFMQIGALRNRLAHQDFAAYPVDATLDEMAVLARRSELFLHAVIAELARCGPPAGPATAGGRS